jgi:hypothetical protein
MILDASSVTDQLLIDSVRLRSSQGQIGERLAKCDDVNENTNIHNFQTICHFISLPLLHSLIPRVFLSN